MADEPKKEEPATGTETETTPPEQTPPAATEKPNDEEVLAAAQNPDAVKRALDAERETAKAAQRERDEALAKVKEYEDANKSDLEKAQTEATDATTRAATAEAKALRLEVALDKKVPAELIDRLRGETKEELETDADALMALVGSGDGDGKGSATPPGSFDGGARKPTPNKNLDEQIAEAEKAGDTKRSIALKSQKLAQVRDGKA
jgi:hypothetical protein